jgi:hypothetical protein
MRVAQTELINCHDCGRPISFSARACPGCGSLEPAGPYVQSRREQRRLRREERNDHTLFVNVIGCAPGGAFYGDHGVEHLLGDSVRLPSRLPRGADRRAGGLRDQYDTPHRALDSGLVSA